VSRKIKNVVLILGVAAMWSWFYKAAPYKKIKVPSPVLAGESLEQELSLNSTFPLTPKSLSEIQRCFQGNEKLQMLLQKPSFKIQDLKDIKNMDSKSMDQFRVDFNFEGKALLLIFNRQSHSLPQGKVQLFQRTDNIQISRPLPAPWQGLAPLEILRMVKAEFPVTQLQERVHWQIDTDIDLHFSDEGDELQDLALTIKDGSHESRTLICKAEKGLLSCHCAPSP
jgi:hypothetical protein